MVKKAGLAEESKRTERLGGSKKRRTDNNYPWLPGRGHTTQILLPLMDEDANLSDTPGSKEQPHVCWSTVDKDPSMRVSDGGKTVTGMSGYRCARATHPVASGSWFYEVEMGDASSEVTRGPGGPGHCRVGWAMDRLDFEDIDTPVGYASEGAKHGFGWSYCSKDGGKFHMSRKQLYGRAYKAGDIIGCLLVLPPGNGISASQTKQQLESATLVNTQKERQRFHSMHWLSYLVPEEPQVHKGSLMEFYINGEPQGVAFTDLWAGSYFPAVSCYYGGVCKASFGPTFKHPPPKGLDYRPLSEAASLGTPLLDQGKKVVARQAREGWFDKPETWAGGRH